MAPKVVVHKYGGSSVADVDRLKIVARRVVDTVGEGYRVVVVISAMGRTTDELLSLARTVSPSPSRRELDMLVSAGERIAAALLAMAVEELGQAAVSFTGSQCGIVTTHRHTDARILEVRPYRVQDELDEERVVIIAGYQGVSYKRDVTTLGRGGSDTTAVAMAAALGAEYCEICSDVDGVYSADPKVVEAPRHLPQISYDEMQELSLHGARVLNAQAVEFARQHKIVIFARATSGSQRFTRVAGPRAAPSAAVGVTGVEGLDLLQGEGGPQQLNRIGEVLERFEVAPLWAQLQGGNPFVVLVRERCHDVAGLRAELANSGPLQLLENLEAASVVGQGLGDDPAHLRALLEVAEAAGAEVVAVDTAPLRLTLLMRAGRLARTQQLLHRRFVEATDVDVEI